jgi:hypothetical protein
MPDWVTSLKLGGDFRGRFDQIDDTDNKAYTERIRFRYRLRFGVTASLLDNMEVGFRLASGDPATAGSFNNAGNPLSSNSTFTDNGTKKNIYIDQAYAKWTAIHTDDWRLTGIIGKMENPMTFTPMVFNSDYTPEGAGLKLGYTINDRHELAVNGGAFVLDEESGATEDPYLLGSQILLNSKWNEKLSSSVGVGFLTIGNGQQLTSQLPGGPAGNVPYGNQGNTRVSNGTTGVLVNAYDPFVASASVVYKLDKFAFYPGAFPIKLTGEFITNPRADSQNNGYWAGITFGKAGKKNTWDFTYRYVYLEADAWYDQVVDDTPVVFYQTANAGTGVSSGAFAGTNLKGHMLKLNYSLTDALTFSLTGYITGLIEENLPGSSPPVHEPNSTASHFQADLMWKF